VVNFTERLTVSDVAIDKLQRVYMAKTGKVSHDIPTLLCTCRGLNYNVKFRHLFNGLFSRTTWVSQRQERQTILDFNKARNDGVEVASAGPCANHFRL